MLTGCSHTEYLGIRIILMRHAAVSRASNGIARAATTEACYTKL
jgi:hypothetical protein